MDIFCSPLSPQLWVIALSIAVLGRIVKGVVGFAMPIVVVSGLSSNMGPEQALAGLILPTLVANGTQALRQGIAPAWASAQRFGVYMVVGGLVLVASAQLVRVLSISVLLGLIGVAVTLFTVTQLIGWRLSLARQRKDVEAGIGAFAGLMGGVIGYLGTAHCAVSDSAEHGKNRTDARAGRYLRPWSVALVGAHFGSGVLRAETLPLSLTLIAPALLGQ